MARLRSNIKVGCPYKCGAMGKKCASTIIKRGINRAKHRQYYCVECRRYFVETVGTLFYHRKLNNSQVKAILEYLKDEKGVRYIERKSGHHRDTISLVRDQILKHVSDRKSFDAFIKGVKLSWHDQNKLWDAINKSANRDYHRVRRARNLGRTVPHRI